MKYVLSIPFTIYREVKLEVPTESGRTISWTRGADNNLNIKIEADDETDAARILENKLLGLVA